MKTSLTLLLIFIATTSSGQVYLEDGNFNLKDLDFNTFNSKEFYSKQSKAEWAEYHKKRKSDVSPIYFFQSEADTININGSNFEVENPYAIQYRQTAVAGSNTWDERYNIAFYDAIEFDELNVLTDLENNLILVSVSAEKVANQKISTLINALNREYGPFKLAESSVGFSRYSNRKWILEDKIISLVSDAKIDFKNVVLSDEAKKDIYKNSAHLNAVYLFICKKVYYDQIKNMSTRIGFMSKFED